MPDIRTYDREDFLKRAITDGIEELDLQSLDISDFSERLLRENMYVITASDAYRPDLIAQRVYGITSLWWVLLKLNGINDIWHDLTPGTVLMYPNLSYLKVYLNDKLKSV